ncbi:metal-dependent hydrolase [Streptomyces aidingensis]|uniref:LexA-binding, inner membrane-associated putative hydrolase n=1 Tax=Streptomyces aidingensis TaxID=910347 RepID=A0A1I1MZI4_9ACTN|nr:metal-dependent hydrolase [Streptomyces aidingensis]SFC90789.1 LexA-binding, inner membrane-associated putative hydrolase [Streptomyces aidingensis]
MMGPAHSLSGAMAWLAAGLGTAAAGHPMPWPVLVAGTLICAGAALAPDLDQKSATISRAFGPPSRWLAGLIDLLSVTVYNISRGRGDRKRTGGHRTLTHTWVWAVAIGAGFSAAAVYWGRWAVLVILFVHMVLAVEGLLWRAARVSSDVLVWLLGATAAWIMAGVLDRPGNGSDWLFAGEPYLWIGVPIVLGAIVHTIGDSLTVSGCPMFWPLPIAGRRWYPVGTPKFMRFNAGAWVENTVLMPAFMVVGAGCAVGAVMLAA